MDIEPLWALGGWFLLQNCMAAPKSTPIFSEFHSKYSSHPLLFFISLLFIFLLLVRPADQVRPFSPSAIPAKRVLSESPSSSSSSSTMKINPKSTQNPSHGSSSSSSRSQGFEAEAHEVPSGPNPISN